LPTASKRWAYAVWVVLVGAFAVMHAMHLSADFPNHTPWFGDWAKYTDEGWYGNAAIRAHLFGNWHIPGDFNPAPVVPVWPFLEWILFFFTGVTVEAARGLAVAFFFANLLLCYLLLRPRGPRWMALLAPTLMVTSPFLYCFSRLAILEPMLTALMLAALNVTFRLPRMRRPLAASVGIGVLFTLMMFTKTTAIFLLPALGWALLASFWESRRPDSRSSAAIGRPWIEKQALRCAAAAMSAFVFTYGLWMAVVVYFGFYADYKYFFFINTYVKPTQSNWPLLSFWWSFHGGLWVDRILIPLTGLLFIVAAVAGTFRARRGADQSSFVGRSAWGRRLLLDPVFGASILAVAGYILFMTYQNHPQPRYFVVVAVFCFLAIARSLGEMVTESGWARLFGIASIALVAFAAVVNGAWTLSYATHPEYTFVTAAQRLTRYIDEHPNGNRLLVSISGDEITLVTHLRALCDDFGTPTPTYPDLGTKLALYQPGWWATWNDIDPGTLEDIHTHFSLEQVASFRAFDDPERNMLVLFKLHPLPGGQVRNMTMANLQAPLPDDTIDIPVE
jgi:Dolichyl-phosphate-mannose-protein mannosyltransferase